jgi:hypothetical protein
MSDNSDVIEPAVEAIVYETWMLNEARNALAASLGRNASANFMALESFLVHYRNLRDFLYPHDPKPVDILARQFSSAWDQVAPKWPANNSERKKLNARLFHISTLRTDDGQWPISAMADRIGRCLDAWWQSMSAEEQERMAAIRVHIRALLPNPNPVTTAVLIAPMVVTSTKMPERLVHIGGKERG